MNKLLEFYLSYKDGSIQYFKYKIRPYNVQHEQEKQ